MLEVMYDLPAQSDVKKCIVTKNSVTKGERPVLMLADGTPKKYDAKSDGKPKAESA